MPLSTLAAGTLRLGGGSLHALHASSGTEQWRVEVPWEPPAQRIEGDGVVSVTTAVCVASKDVGEAEAGPFCVLRAAGAVYTRMRGSSPGRTAFGGDLFAPEGARMGRPIARSRGAGSRVIGGAA